MIVLLLVNGMMKCAATNCTYVEALNAFAADRPEHAAELDELLDWHELCGTPQKAHRTRPESSKTRPKAGSGARFRQLIQSGSTNAEALALVRAEFPESKADAKRRGVESGGVCERTRRGTIPTGPRGGA